MAATGELLAMAGRVFMTLLGLLLLALVIGWLEKHSPIGSRRLGLLALAWVVTVTVGQAVFGWHSGCWSSGFPLLVSIAVSLTVSYWLKLRGSEGRVPVSRHD